jgi:hypothetical protein
MTWGQQNTEDEGVEQVNQSNIQNITPEQNEYDCYHPDFESMSS